MRPPKPRPHGPVGAQALLQLLDAFCGASVPDQCPAQEDGSVREPQREAVLGREGDECLRQLTHRLRLAAVQMKLGGEGQAIGRVRGVGQGPS
ncbi:hypothetical protein D3C72_2234960 [compost metagenome]